MNFNSLDFVLFFLVFILLWPIIKRHDKSRYVYLTLSSFLFYGWWDWRFLFLILFSGFIDYFAAFFMRGRYRRVALWSSLAGNIGSLAIFKYAEFFAENWNRLCHFSGVQLVVPEFSIILPVGISFYTFQSMSYSIDVFRGQLKPVRSVFLFFSYLAMFPQLVAGPIVRATDVIEQIRKPLKVDSEALYFGIRCIGWGLFCKTVIADTVGPIVDSHFAVSTEGDMWFWWMIMTLFAFQIYCDFNGYSLIAIGLARLMGFQFLDNFNHPYHAASFSEFWARWHISLSTWFRDYLYIPLGGNRVSAWRQKINLWVTMLVSGLWHGASWNFVIWGGVHAFYLSVERAIGWRPQKTSAKLFAPLIIFPLVVISWVFFRAEDLSQSVFILKKMMTWSAPDWTYLKLTLTVKGFFACFVLVSIETWIFLRNTFHWSLKLGEFVEPVLLAWAFAAAIYLRGPGGDFIYFQF